VSATQRPGMGCAVAPIPCLTDHLPAAELPGPRAQVLQRGWSSTAAPASRPPALTGSPSVTSQRKDVRSPPAGDGVLCPCVCPSQDCSQRRRSRPARSAVAEVRGPLGPRHRWSLWTDGRWPRLTPRFLEGAALWDPPFAGVVHGVRTLHPTTTCRSRPPSVRATRSEHLRADWF
jgi:hypothetical protein